MAYKAERIPILDGIRAYAVLAVCIVHFFHVDETGLYETNRLVGVFLFKITDLGARGVELFFILSGFLITGILIDTKKSSRFFTSFYARRFLRIFPLYYTVLFVTFIILPRFYHPDSEGLKVIDNQVWLWTYTSNLSFLWDFNGWAGSQNFPWVNHFWSLCVEEHFYVVWPLIIYITNEKWLPKMMYIILFISLLSVILSYIFNDMFPILKWTTIRCGGVLSLGGLIAYFFRSPRQFDRLSALALKYLWPTAGLLILVNFIPRRYALNDLATFITSATFFAMLLVVSIKGNRITDRLFDHKILFFIGKISYGIYIYHGMVRPFLYNYLYTEVFSTIPNTILSSSIYTLVCTLISILIAWVSWQVLEEPILRAKKYFNYNPLSPLTSKS